MRHLKRLVATSALAASSLAAGLVGPLAAPSVAAAETILVSTTHMRCVVDNLSVYRNAGSDPVLIIFDRCPNPVIDPAALSELAVTQRLASGSSSGPAPAMSLRKAELDCLADPTKAAALFSRAQGGVIEWPDNVCTL